MNSHVQHVNTTDVQSGTSLATPENGEANVVKTELFEVHETEIETDNNEIQPIVNRAIMNTFPNQTPMALLSRPHKVLGIDLTAITGRQVRTDFFQNWLNANWRHLHTFSLFRCNFKLKILIRGAASVYGVLMASWHYQKPIGTDDIGVNQLMKDSTARTELIDIGTAEAVEFTIPYVYPTEYFSLLEVTNGVPNCPEAADYFTFIYNVLGIASISGGGASAEMEVWMSAEEIDCGGYQTQPRAVAPLAKFFKDKSFEETGIITGESKQEFLERNTAGEMLGVGALGASSIFKYMYDTLSGGTSSYTGAIPQGVFPEGVKNMSEGMVANNAASGVKIAMFGDLNSPEPQPQIPILATKSLAALDGRYFADGNIHRLADIAKIATVVDSYDLVADTGNIYQLGLKGLWAFAIGQHFRFWRGSVRVGLNFFSSPLVATRVQVSVVYNSGSTAASTPTGDDSSVPLHNFLIRGTTKKVFDIPYHASGAMLNCPIEQYGNTTPGTSLGTLLVQVISPPTAFVSGEVPKVFTVVTMSTGPDIKFYSVRTIPGPDMPLPPVLIEGESLRTLHDVVDHQFGDGSAQELSLLPHTETIEELMRRWSFRRNVTPELRYGPRTFSNEIDPIKPTSGNVWGCKVDAICPWFALSRGALDIRVSMDKETPTGTPDILFPYVSMNPNFSFGPFNSADCANGSNYTSNSLQPVLEYTAPYLNRFRASRTWGGFDPVPVDTNMELFMTDQIKSVVIARAGTNFQVFNLNCLPDRISKWLTT